MASPTTATPDGDDGGGPKAGETAPMTASMTAQQIHDATLMLRRPTVVDAIQESVPVPPGAVPRNGLPCWRKIPLGSKLPIIDHPKDAFVFYRDKLGKKLWRASPVNAFRLDDPYMREVDYEYEAVHDPALRRMFQSPEHRGVLLDRGFVLPTEEAVCSLRQFNTYRRYLQTIHRELVREEYRRRAVDLSDEQTMRRARVCEEKQLLADQKRMEQEKKHTDQKQRLQDERRKQQQQLVARQTRYLELMQRVEERKAEERELAAERARKLDEEVKYRNALAAEIQRAKVVATVQAWRRDERERKARLEKQQQQLQAYKEREVRTQWEKKIQCQEEREERDKRLLARQEEAMKLAVELRNKKLEREDLRMQALLKKIKTSREKQRAKRLRRPAKRMRPGRPPRPKQDADGEGSGGPRRRRRRIASAGLTLDDEDLIQLEKVFNVSMQIVRTGKEERQQNLVDDNLWKFLRDSGFDATKTRNGVPEAVAHAMDSLFDAVMDGIVHKMVMKTLKVVYHKALDRCCALLEDLPARELAQRGWACNHGVLKHTEIRRKSKKRANRGNGGVDDDDDDDDEGQDRPRAANSSARQPHKKNSQEECERMKRQIEALERKNEQLRKALEQAVSSSTLSMSSDDGREAQMDLDANFEVLAKSLLREMVAIAAQSVSEHAKLTIRHRWKVMKEVELFELVDRLCLMMMTKTPKQFLQSTEFHWAADILARDVMREVQHQMRQGHRNREKEKQAQRARDGETISRRAPVKSTSRLKKRNRSVQGSLMGLDESEHNGVSSSGHKQGHVHVELTVEPLDESKVPLLRLHKRSPHQPSIPSLESIG